MRTALQEGSESEEDKETAGEAIEVKVALYNDCVAAMAFVLDKERGFHRVRHAVARCEEYGSDVILPPSFTDGVRDAAGIKWSSYEQRPFGVRLRFCHV